MVLRLYYYSRKILVIFFSPLFFLPNSKCMAPRIYISIDINVIYIYSRYVVYAYKVSVKIELAFFSRVIIIE